MVDIQTISAIIFIILLSILLYIKRKNLETKQIIPYVLYFSMYRTKLGIRLMDSWAKKFRRPVMYLGYFGIFIGFLGMILISYSLVSNLYHLFTKPEASPGVGLVLPFKAKGVFFVPFFYWIISIFIIAVVHEFLHGLIARTHNLKVKSSGFAFVGLIIPILPAAFVEPDEKELRKRPHKQQLSVFAAGPLANIIAGFLFFAIALFIITPIVNASIEANGVRITDYVKGDNKFPAENAGIGIGEIVHEVDGQEIAYVENLSTALRSKKPGDKVEIKTDAALYKLELAKNPENESLAYIGVYLEQETKVKDNVNAIFGKFLPNAVVWIYGLLIILAMLNLGIGLFNLAPIGPLDGGRMLQIAMHKFFDKEKGDKVWGSISLFFLALIIVNIIFGFVR